MLRRHCLKLREKAPSPAGEGWGEENKNKAKALFDPLILTFSLREKELSTLKLTLRRRNDGNNLTPEC
jgi:hypothetical protein